MTHVTNGGNVYHFDPIKAEEQLKGFAMREISFRVAFMDFTYRRIAAMASTDESQMAASTVANLAQGKTKHPRFHTLVSVLMALGFEFDAIASEAVQTGFLEVQPDGKVVQIRKQKGVVEHG